MKKLFLTWKKKRELRKKDEMWSMLGGNCFGLFPPSFYATHSSEEAQQIKQAEIEKLKKILSDFIANEPKNP